MEDEITGAADAVRVKSARARVQSHKRMPGGRPTVQRGAEEGVKAKLCAEEISEACGGAQGRRRWLQARKKEKRGQKTGSS